MCRKRYVYLVESGETLREFRVESGELRDSLFSLEFIS